MTSISNFITNRTQKNFQWRNSFCCSRASGRGFTLIEMIITISVTAIVMTSLVFVVIYFYRTNAYVLEQATAVETAHTGVLDVMHYLREATYGADGSYPITNANASSVSFYVDMKGDGVIDQVRLYLSGTTLYEGVTAPAGNPPTYASQPETISTIATYVHNSALTPIFRYYDSYGGLLASPVRLSDIASVNTTVTVNINPLRAPNDFTLSIGATLRNLRNVP